MQIKFKKGFILTCFAAGVIFNGCATSIETSRKIMGTSIEALDEARAEGKSQTVELDYPACYQKVITILKKMKAHIFLHSQKRKRIVAMNFRDLNNTTEVGIFFTQVTPNSTKVEISCLSHSVLENVSDKIFSALKDKNL